MQDDEKETRDILAEKIRRFYSCADTENIRRYGCPGMAGSPMRKTAFDIFFSSNTVAMKDNLPVV